MIKKLKTFIVTLFASSLFALPVLAPAIAHAQTTTTPNITDSLCTGANLSTTQTDCAGSTATASDSVNNIITTVINIFSLIVGVVAVIMIIVGGFRYITSGGDSGNVSGAKNTILFAIVGLVIVALAQIIVKFVLGKVTQTGS